LVRAVFFDAGNTLVFPDRTKTLAPLLSRGVTVSEDFIFASERAARHFRDANAGGDPKHTDQQYWNIFYSELLSHFPAHQDTLPALVAAARTSSNWCMVPPSTRETLLSLKQQYRLGVISNSDGGMPDLLARLGLADCFETTIDSALVGYQKPHPEIFRAALQEVNVPAEDSVYVGDVYSIDYTGARAAGMQAILMDPYGTYAQNGVRRITRLEDLEPLLTMTVFDD